MTRDEQWLLNEKYSGKKTEVLELLNDFIAFQSRAKLEKKVMKASEMNTHSLSESELLFAQFCTTTMQNKKSSLILKTYGEIVKKFLADCARLKAHEPLAYIIGSIPFLHTTIFLDSHPLIPRTETEFWVEHIISEMKTVAKHPLKILDLCAGSGCIGVAVLTEIPHAHVDFAEIDTLHHSTIQKNISENTIDQTRAEIFGGSLFENIHGTYDYILTNPPYIDPIKNQTDENVKKFEPSLALFAEDAGMKIILDILEQAPKFLKQNGVLVIEHDPEQSDSIHVHAKPYGFACTTHLDQFGLQRYTVCVRKDNTNMPQ